jgi:hypothetical protein
MPERILSGVLEMGELDQYDVDELIEDEVSAEVDDRSFDYEYGSIRSTHVDVSWRVYGRGEAIVEWKHPIDGPEAAEEAIESVPREFRADGAKSLHDDGCSGPGVVLLFTLQPGSVSVSKDCASLRASYDWRARA